MDLEDKDFLEFAKYANEENLNYIIIGGFAMNLHGFDRHTEDIDIWVEPTNLNKNRIIKVFVKLGYSLSELTEIEKLDFTDYVVFSAIGYLDILTIVHKSLNYYDCFKYANKHRLVNSAICYFLHINHLRESKILAHRPQDLRDVILIDDLLNSQNKK